MRIFVVVAVALACMLTNPAHAGDIFESRANGVKTVKLFPGWDNISEPLDYDKSFASWQLVDCVEKIKCSLKVVFSLSAAQPNKVYQVGLHFLNLCKNPPTTFGAFGLFPADGCSEITRDGVTAGVRGAELGAVVTDSNGDGSVSIVVPKPARRDYKVTFTVRNGAGCNISGGAGQGACVVDFRSPGMFGDTQTIKVK